MRRTAGSCCRCRHFLVVDRRRALDSPRARSDGFCARTKVAWSTTRPGIRPVCRLRCRMRSLVERGEYLARAADCMACHTAPGGKEFAGGLGINLPFGTLYSTNITPDPETGIGKYSDQDFLNALHRGRRRDGARLYPAMPFTSYTYISDADALAIKAYLFSLSPARVGRARKYVDVSVQPALGDEFLDRDVQSDVRFKPDTSRSLEWNRGAYLAEALAHCGECHTPRNLAFALDNRRKFAGAITAGWRAFNITSDKATGVGAWSDEDLAALSFDRPRKGAWHRLGTDGGGRRPKHQPVCARGYPRRGRLICARCQQSTSLICPRRSRRLASASPKAGGSTADVPRQDDIRRRMRELPRLDRRKRNFALCHAHGRLGGQRSCCAQMSHRS